MRLTPIDTPTSPLLWLAYKLTQRQLGTVIIPLKTIYARKPALLPLLDKITRYQSRQLTIDERSKLLIKAYGSFLNGCEFCHDIALAEVIKHQLGETTFQHLAQWEQQPEHYSEAEQAILHFVQGYHKHRAVSDAVYAGLCQHFSDAQIIDIVSINAIEQYYNAMNKPFNLPTDGLADLARH